jgi:hypothetical protein
MIKIPMLETADIETALIENKIDPLKARQVAATAEGNYREALQLLQHAEEDWQGILRDWLNSIIKNRSDRSNKMGGRDQSSWPGKTKTVSPLFQSFARAVHPVKDHGKQY